MKTLTVPLHPLAIVEDSVVLPAGNIQDNPEYVLLGKKLATEVGVSWELLRCGGLYRRRLLRAVNAPQLIEPAAKAAECLNNQYQHLLGKARADYPPGGFSRKRNLENLHLGAEQSPSPPR